MKSRRIFVAFVLAAALLAGPAAAACVDCCPDPAIPLSVAPAAECCGDCPVTVEGPPEPASAVLLRAAARESGSLAVLVTPQFSLTPRAAGALLPLDSRPPATSPPRALAPLRL